MAEDYGSMSISDWNSARDTVARHLAHLMQKDSSYRAVYETVLIHLIVDIFMVQQTPKNMSTDEFLTKYTALFREGLGINFQSLEPDDDA